MIPQNPVPMLWVIPPDVINGVSAGTLAAFIKRLDNVHVWELDCGAVAYSLPDILVKRGRPVDYEAFLKRLRPLFQNPYEIPDSDALDLEIPDNKYWVRISLKPEETNKRSCRYIKSHLNEWNPFAFKAYSSSELSTEDAESLKVYLMDWLLTTGKRSVCGESLCIGNTELSAYTMPGSAKFYPETGYEVRCSDYSPCTWPWIDLYLRMRRDLPVKKRLSMRFFNEVDPDIQRRMM